MRTNLFPIIGLVIVLVALFQNGYFVYHMIVPKDCFVRFEGLTYCNTTKIYLFDNGMINVQRELGNTIVTDKKLVVSEDLPQVQFYSHILTEYLWSVKNKNDLVKQIDEGQYYFVMSATNNSVRYLSPEFILVQQYQSEFRTPMLFRKK